MKADLSALPKWLWYPRMATTVEVLRSGHFPTSVMVKASSDGKTYEVETSDLEIPASVAAPKL